MLIVASLIFPGAGNKTAVGFYGLDLYSLFTSVDRVIEYLNKIDPEDAKKAKRRFDRVVCLLSLLFGVLMFVCRPIKD